MVNKKEREIVSKRLRKQLDAAVLDIALARTQGVVVLVDQLVTPTDSALYAARLCLEDAIHHLRRARKS